MKRSICSRGRSYGVPGEADSVFVELKKKFDGVVYKRRITAELPLVEPFLAGLLDRDAFGQIGQEIEWFQRCNRTAPKAFIGYDRKAFAGLTMSCSGSRSCRRRFSTSCAAATGISRSPAPARRTGNRSEACSSQKVFV